jgi:hypothetical protein
MSRASKERERLAKRNSYRDAVRVSKLETSLIQGPYDLFSRAYAVASEAERRQEMKSRLYYNRRDSSAHEAGHGIGAWLQGLRILYMKMNDSGSHYHDVDLDHVDAMTVTGEPLTAEEERNGKSSLQGTGEGYVIGCQHAFVTLAGALAEHMYLKEKAPITVREHLWSARAEFHFFTGLDEKACKEFINRLVQVVVDAFKDERIRYVTFALASILWERRNLSGEEVLNVINAAWEDVTATTANICHNLEIINRDENDLDELGQQTSQICANLCRIDADETNLEESAEQTREMVANLTRIEQSETAS